MEIDITGAHKVGEIIEQSKFDKFIIFRYGGSRQQAPIFECLETKSPQQAKQSFLDWAKVTDNALAYDLVLTTKKGEAAEESATGKKPKELKFSFQLKVEDKKAESQSGDFNTLLTLALEKQAAQFKNDAMLLEIAEMRKELREIREEEEEESGISGINKGIDVNAIISAAISGLLSKYIPQTPAAQMSGIETDPRLMAAINTLHRFDSDIVKDLEILAKMAENETATFNIVLSQLRAFKK